MKEKIKTILLDDEEDAVERLSRMLKLIPEIEIIAKYTNPQKCINEIKEKIPDLLFTDVEMPGISGFDVVKQIEKQDLKIRFIFVTAYDHYAIKAIHAAAFDYLIKPVDFDELGNVIEKYIQSKERRHRVPFNFVKEYNLTEREVEIIELLLKGFSSEEIGQLLFVSKHTINTHRRNILEKTNFSNSTELITTIFNL